jgi:hypothetical protein
MKKDKVVLTRTRYNVVGMCLTAINGALYHPHMNQFFSVLQCSNDVMLYLVH